jgi:ABC-type oligopeptide transport system ATPase subunit
MKNKNKNNELINFYELEGVKKLGNKYINPNYSFHKIEIPFRGVIIGSSGSGKSLTVMNLINAMPNTFNHIYIYTKAQEKLYDYIQQQLPADLLTISYNNLGDCQNHIENEVYYGQSLCIFDDMVNEKNQKCIEELYIRGRKIAGGISILYLSQSYFKIPKIIRLQCQYIFIIKVSGIRDLKLILSDYSLNTTTDELLKKYNYVSKEFNNFFLIDLVSPNDKTYRKNFLEYI